MNRVSLYSFRIVAVLGMLFVLFAMLTAAWIPRAFSGATELNILTWGGLIEPDVLHEFEKRYNAKVNIVYFESTEELAAKLAIARNAQYDLITPTDSTLGFFVRNDLIEPIDASRIERWPEMHERLREFGVMHGQLYALPYAVILYGIGMRVEHALENPSWSILFEKPQGYKIGMTDDPVDVMNVVAQYLYGTVNQLDSHQAEQAYQVLKRQRPWVEAYSELRADYFLSTGACKYILTPSYAIQLARKQGHNLVMQLPREGGFVISDQLAIARGTTKLDLVYALINWVLSSDNIVCTTREEGFLPPFESDINQLDTVAYLHYTASEIFTRLYSTLPRMRPLMGREDLNHLWIRLKA